MADSIEKLKNDKKLQAMASEVQAICGEKSLEEILVDLYKTQSVELTINRIFDGNVTFFAISLLQFELYIFIICL
jgi:hypothetical protein